MLTITRTERTALDHLRAGARASRAGGHWERRTLSNLPEITALMMVHPALRRAVCDAVVRLAQAQESDARLDVSTISHVTAVLDALHREGGFELRRWADDLREELYSSRGRTVAEILAPTGCPSRPAQLPKQVSNAGGISRLPEPSSATTT